METYFYICETVYKSSLYAETFENSLLISIDIGCNYSTYFYRFANKKAYIIFYGVVGCIFSATYAYFNGTLTTLEKRFKIPSKTSG